MASAVGMAYRFDPGLLGRIITTIRNPLSMDVYLLSGRQAGWLVLNVLFNTSARSMSLWKCASQVPQVVVCVL